MTRPNILLLLSDEHAADIAGFAGYPHVNTENLDRLADRAVRFDAAISPCPVCTPARMCMLTGKDVHHCAAWNNHYILFPEQLTWPEHFANHGYTTCLVGKMHFGGHDQMQGFQYRPYGDLKHGLGHQPEPLSLFPGYANPQSAAPTEIPESLLSDGVIARESLAFLLEHQASQADKPWFLCAGFTRPHAPYTAPGRYFNRYRDKTPHPPAPASIAGDLEPFAREYYDTFGYGELSEEQTRRGVEGYHAAVDFMDDCVGELLDGLDKAGLLENTIIIYSSDHGEMMGRHGLWAKAVYYEEALRVPLLVTGPGIGQGQTDKVISLIDLFPTMCSLAGLPIPEGLDGVDFSDVLADPTGPAEPRSHATSCYYKYAVRVKHIMAPDLGAPNKAMRLSRQRDWKYVEIEGGRPLLFNLADDPHELHNLADDPACAERCEQMRREALGGMSWEEIHRQLIADQQRMPEFFSGVKPTMPNQYRLPDGRIFDAEAELYNSRWLPIPDGCTGGIIPQMFG
jgi:choline-sulfatase